MIGVLTFFISVILYFAMIIITYSVFESKRGKNIFIDALWGLGAVFPFLVVKFLHKDIPLINSLGLAGVIIVNFVMLNFRRKGKIWEKGLLILLNEASLFLGEMSLLLIFSKQISELESWSFSNPMVYILFTVDGLLGVTIYYIVSSIWKKIRNKRLYSLKRGFIFLFFPLSQVMLLYSQNSFFFREYADIDFIMIAGVLLCVLADFLLLVSIYNQNRMEEARERIEELNRAWNIEKEYYLELAKKQEELGKIRHDMNAQFIVLRDMANKNDTDGINSMIDTLSSYIGSTKTKVYCSDSTINAVMNEYESICSDRNIELKYVLGVKETLALDPVVICSLLSNVLKNAIEATESLDGERTITLNLGTKGGYFHLVETNPFNPDFIKSGHKGLGMEILRGIVERYDGEMISNAEDRKYTIELSVKNVKKDFSDNDNKMQIE